MRATKETRFMTRSFTRYGLLTLCAVGFLLVASASRPGSAHPVFAQGATDTATEAAAVSAAGTLAATESDAGFSLRAPTIGLAALSSYRASVALSFSGTRRGQSGQWSRTITMLASQK